MKVMRFLFWLLGAPIIALVPAAAAGWISSMFLEHDRNQGFRLEHSAEEDVAVWAIGFFLIGLLLANSYACYWLSARRRRGELEPESVLLLLPSAVGVVSYSP